MSMEGVGIGFPVGLEPQNEKELKSTDFQDCTYASLCKIKKGLITNIWMHALFDPKILCCYLIYYTDNNVYILVSYLYDYGKLGC